MDFKDKKITLMGLGLLGGAVNDAIFLAKHGAKLTVTDLKSAEELAPSIEKLKGFEDIKFVLGEHRLEDFKNADFILQPGNVPTDSPYLAEARKNDIPVYVSESLFVENAPKDITLVGVTGTRGKSTVTQIIFEVLQKNPPGVGKVHLSGNVRNASALSLLDDIGTGDIVVLELDSWALHGMGAIKVSPHIAVFTTFMPDHLNYYKGDLNQYLSDKANIFRFQKEDDVLILGEKMVSILGNFFGLDRIRSRKIITGASDVPESWNIKIPGEHNRYNIACAIEALRQVGLGDDEIRQGVESFEGVAGRLEAIQEGVYNDTTSTTPDATLAGLRAVSSGKNVVLIMGGSDKDIDPNKLLGEMEEYVKVLILLPGSGTDKVVARLLGKDFKVEKVDSLEEAVTVAKKEKGEKEVVLFSPGFASFGLFKNEYDRGDQFNKLWN